MNWTKYLHSRMQRTLQSALFLGGLLAAVLLVAWLFLGGLLAAWTAVVMALVLGFGARAPVDLLMRWHHAQQVPVWQASALHRNIGELARRANLEKSPRLFYVATLQPQAFAVGTREDSAIAITQGLLDELSPPELIGVLAHEISHIASGDLQWMSMANAFRRILSMLAFMVWLAVPLAVFGFMPGFSPWLLPLVVVLPTGAALAESALGRVREFDADLAAAGLTGNPGALASALWKLEQNQARLRWWQPFWTRQRPANHWSSHPPTELRVQRLLELMPEGSDRRTASSDRAHSYTWSPRRIVPGSAFVTVTAPRMGRWHRLSNVPRWWS
jgi:heat shock protein HtpX